MAARNVSKNFGIGPLKAIGRRKSLGQNVFDTLRHAIARGDISPGSRLVESRIAEALEISRTPVREAIHKLEREGFISRLPRGGFTVLGFSRKDIEETFGIRSVLESYAAHLAAVNHREEELVPLENKITEFQKSLDQGRMDRLVKINTEFHDLLYALSRNPRLIKMINALRDQIYQFRRIILEKKTMAQASNKDHRLMLDCIRKRDAEGAERLVRQHIIKGQEAVLADFNRFRGKEKSTS